MARNEKNIAGRIGNTAKSRADIAAREFKMGLLSDLRQSLSITDAQGGEHAAGVYVVGYVSLDVVVLSAPAALLEPEARTASWRAAFQVLGHTDLASLVLVEHAVGEDGITGERLIGPVTVELEADEGAKSKDENRTRKVA